MKRMGELTGKWGYLGVNLVEIPPGLDVDNEVCKIPVLGMLKLVRGNYKQEGDIFSEDENSGIVRLPLDYTSYLLGEGVVNDVLKLYSLVIWVTSGI